MIQFEKLVLDNYILYKNAVWELNKHPVTVIRGRNLNHKAQNDKNTNGVGKTLLPSALANLVLNQPPFASKKNSSRDMLSGNASASLFMTDHAKHHHEIKQFVKGKSVKLEITTDNKKQNILRGADARDELSRIIPLNSDHFYSQILISRWRTSVLMFGTAAQRHDYIESIFDLQIYDAVAKLFAQRKYKMEASKSSLNELSDKYKQLESNLSSKSLAELKTLLKTLGNRSKKLLRKISNYNDEITKLSAYISIADQLQTELGPDKLSARLKAAQGKLQKLDRKLAAYHEQIGEARNARKVMDRRIELQRKLRKLPKRRYQTLKLKNSQAKLDIKLQRINSMLQTKNKYNDQIDKYASIARDKLPKKISTLSEDKLKQRIDKLTKRTGAVGHSLGQITKLENKSVCPVCAQPLKKDHVTHFTQQFEAELKTGSKKLRVLKTCYFVQKVERLVPREARAIKTSTLRSKISNTEQELNDVAERLEIERKRKDYRKLLAELPEVSKTNVSTRSMDRVVRKRDALQASCEQFRADLRLHEQLIKIGYDFSDITSTKQRYGNLQKLVKTLSPRLQDLNNKFSRLTSQYSNERMIRAQITEISNSVQDIEKQIKHMDVISALANAYSPRGIRLLQIASLANTYVTILNDNVDFIYADNMHFTAETAYGKFNLYCNRNSITADIRSLSGAEASMFLALSAYSSLNLMPDEMRTNIMVLDEIEAGMSEVNQQRYTQNFIPLLSELVPNVHVITPLSRKIINIDGAAELFVTKRGKTSELSYSNAK